MNLQKTSKVFGIFARIFEVFFYVGAGICAAAIAVVATEAESLGFKLVEFDEADKLFNVLSQNMEIKTATIIFLILLIIFLLVNAILMRKIGNLFRNINKDYSPFVPGNVKLIKVIAVIAAVVTCIEVGLIPALAIGFVLWGIALLFDYGCALQTESDEII